MYSLAQKAQDTTNRFKGAYMDRSFRNELRRVGIEPLSRGLTSSTQIFKDGFDSSNINIAMIDEKQGFGYSAYLVGAPSQLETKVSNLIITNGGTIAIAYITKRKRWRLSFRDDTPIVWNKKCKVFILYKAEIPESLATTN
jgi:hypothetical protein